MLCNLWRKKMMLNCWEQELCGISNVLMGASWKLTLSDLENWHLVKGCNSLRPQYKQPWCSKLNCLTLPHEIHISYSSHTSFKATRSFCPFLHMVCCLGFGLWACKFRERSCWLVYIQLICSCSFVVVSVFVYVFVFGIMYLWMGGLRVRASKFWERPGWLVYNKLICTCICIYVCVWYNVFVNVKHESLSK